MKKIKMKKNYILIHLAILFLSFNLLAQENIPGKYICKESQRQLIVNADKSFFLIDLNRSVYFYHIDTLSFGDWKQEEKFIVLNTPKSIESRSMKILVEENFIPNSDSLVLEILNPYEDFSRKFENGHRIFEYNFYIDSYDGKFGPEIFMKGNRIALQKSNTDKIVNLHLTIVPNSYLYPSTLAFNYLVTDFYAFKNMNSNYLKIFIPDFTLNYIGYERFKEEYVRIQQNKLILRGEIYEKLPLTNDITNPGVRDR